MDRTHHDGVLIVGAGLAGLSAALSAAPRKVLLLTGAPLNQGCSSAWAQGGMAAALSADDTPALHAADTVSAGAGLVDPAMAELLATEGPAAVRRLAELGAVRRGLVGDRPGLVDRARHARARPRLGRADLGRHRPPPPRGRRYADPHAPGRDRRHGVAGRGACRRLG